MATKKFVQPKAKKPRAKRAIARPVARARRQPDYAALQTQVNKSTERFVTKTLRPGQRISRQPNWGSYQTTQSWSRLSDRQLIQRRYQLEPRHGNLAFKSRTAVEEREYRRLDKAHELSHSVAFSRKRLYESRVKSASMAGRSVRRADFAGADLMRRHEAASILGGTELSWRSGITGDITKWQRKGVSKRKWGKRKAAIRSVVRGGPRKWAEALHPRQAKGTPGGGKFRRK